MYDVFLALIIARALVVSLWRRFPAGFAASAAGGLLWAALVASGWLGKGSGDTQLTGATQFPFTVILVFAGPSAVPGPTPEVPGSALLSAHPIGAKLVIAAIFGVPFVLAWRRALRVSPLSDEASAWKKLALMYLVPILLLLVQGVCCGLTDLACVRI